MANVQVIGRRPDARPRIHSRGIRRLHPAEPLSLPFTTLRFMLNWIMSLLPNVWLWSTLPVWLSNYIPVWILHCFPTWLSNWIQWCPTSPDALEKAEQELLSYIKKPFKVQFVDIGVGNYEEEHNKIWTLMMNTEKPSEGIPLVALHGFASGLGFWVLNLDSLSSARPVYAFDLLGFGRSSRPSFSSSAMEAEIQLVESIEKWREALNLDRFILLGHSLGGFLATSYALRYPDNVAHLILADPWGFLEPPISLSHQYQLPSWIKAISAILRKSNPLAGIRAVGPAGPKLVGKFRSDLSKKFLPVIKKSEIIANYIYHCNAQKPSGEVAFKAMTGAQGWAVHPMICRINELRQDIPITFIYGSRSWVNRQPGIQIKYMRLDSFVDVKVISGAGHHVYADKPEQFNILVNSVCATVNIAERRKSCLVQPNQPSSKNEKDEEVNVGASTSKNSSV